MNRSSDIGYERNAANRSRVLSGFAKVVQSNEILGELGWIRHGGVRRDTATIETKAAARDRKKRERQSRKRNR